MPCISEHSRTKEPPSLHRHGRDIGLNTIFLNVENNDNAQFYKDLGQYGEGAVIESRYSPYIAPVGAVADAQNAFKQSYFARFGTYPDMMGASTYEGVFIAAQAIENAGTTDKAAVRQALIDLEMPQVIEAMKDQTMLVLTGLPGVNIRSLDGAVVIQRHHR